MYCIAKPFFNTVEICFQSGRKQILIIAVPAHYNILFSYLIEYCFHIRYFLCQISMHFHSYKLSVILCKFSYFIKRSSYLGNCFFFWNFSR